MWHGEKRMGDELATVDTETETASETESAASPGPLPLPEGAEPVDGVPGYHALIKGSSVTVFGPDGTEIASGSGTGGVSVGRVGDARLVADGYGYRRLSTFAMLAARHHRAATDPSVRDRVWVRWEADGVAAVYGTDKYDDADLRAVKAGNLYWSRQRQARVTGRRWNPETRDRNLAAVLLAFARQDRNIVVLGPGQTPEDLVTSPTAAATIPAQQTPPTAPAPPPEPEPEPEPLDLTGMSYEELVEAENAASVERSRNYSDAAEGRYRALREERGRRLLDRVATAPAVTELSSEELAAESDWWQTNSYKTPFHSSDEEYRTLERHFRAVRTEQYARIARTILAGPAAADLDDESLESTYEQVGRTWTRLPREHELHDQVADYRKAVQEERIARRARSYGERTPVGEMTLEALIAESDELGSSLNATNEQSSYSYSEAVKEARAARLKAVEAERFQRGLEQNPDAARARLGLNLGGRHTVEIDGSNRGYGYVEREGKKFRALTSYDQRSSIGDFDSAPAAMAALVRRYDQDPETLPRRTWGLEREVDLPVSAHDPLVSWLRRRPSELSPEYDRVLTLLTPYQLPTRTKVANPLTNQVMQAYPFHFEEGLLGELARIAERTTEDLREQSLDENLPKREREAAKRRIPTMGAALIGINAVIEQVRAAGGDVDRRGVDQSRLAAQMAALAGTVNEQEGGEADVDDEPVRDTAAQALGGVPAAGTGGDAGPGPVLPAAGGADERGDRRGGGGPGGGPGAGDGLPGPGGADGADQGNSAGAGAARDAAAAGGRGQPGGAAESGSTGAGGDPQGAGEPVARFRPDPADLPRGPMARAEANLEAIKVLRELESARRGATTEEKRVLARWSGWGSVPTVFLDEPDPDEPIYAPGGEWEGRFEADHARWESYDRVRGELRELLDPFEWRAASRAVLSAHYTPQGVAEAMWQGLAAYGFDGGEVLEAGCGSGAFFGVAPETARLTGVEVDPTTAAIAARIYPHANVLPESFTDTDAPVGTFDLVIGNVPFAQAPFGERRYGATGHSLHNGFIIKQLALLRPGGYMAVITSRWTLDGEDTSARRAMSRWGDLAAAYRLPAGTFGETADTDVVADVLVFRRRAEGEEPGDQTWIDAPERDLGGNTLPVNAYFTQHPENVLGRLTSETGPYGPRVTVQGDPGEAPRLLRERMEASAAAAVADGQGYVPHEDGPDRAPLLLQTAREKHATDFTGRLYTDDDGRIWQHINGEDPVRVITADGVTGTEQLRALLSLRDTASELQELDRTGSDPDRAREVRSQLARLHTAYTTAHGPLSRPRQTRMALPTDEARAAARAAGVDLADDERLPTGWGWFHQDPHAAVVLGLEHWDRANDRPVPSEVLTRRPGTRRGDLEPTDDPKTALSAVMGATGGVDLPLIASLLGTTPEEARRRLGTEVFDNPVTKKLEHAGAYLSGPVRVKLEQAREAAATDPTYAVNVAALEAVQPPPKRLGQFTAQLGAHWIPAPLVQGFLREYLGDPTLQVSHNERYGWSLAAGKVPDAINALKGTERRSAVHIAKALLGRASMVVNVLDGDGVDEDATRAMRYKADAMRSAFEDYCTASTARVTLLTDAYNRQMNGHVVRNYDGLAPTLAGYTDNPKRTPHPWQLSAAARMQFERGVVLAHEVGLGKTTTMVLGSQALKASGQITKPFAVVQPHLARQWLDEAKLLYPNADIRLITSDDLADGNRRPVLEWLRANTPDLVIFTEGAFGSIRMSPEQQELYLFREIESLKEQLKRERGVPHNNFALMQLERRLTTVEARIRRNAAPMRTPGEVYWNDLGFDYALIDEAHRFTAVGFRSKEAGGETASVRAVDLHQKLRWHHQVAEAHGGRPTVTLATGTPMENSIFEQYSVLELATPWLLDQFGVHGPDLWSETFGQKVQRIEMAPDGSGLTIVERFSRFVSKSTMKVMWGLAADTKTGDDVGIERPKLAGGAPELVLVEPTADQRARLQALVARGQAIHAGEVTRDEDNMLAVSGEGRAVALDPRLVDAGAPAANKLVTAADIIAAGYHAHKDHTYAVSSRDDTPHPVPGGLFFVFCNSGTPGGSNKGGFDAYAELRDLLAARGVPRDMVQFAQDHATPEKKAAMSDAANNGGIAVLMGSTEVLGTGFNGQNRAYALMHLDQDWTPASMIQRNGRVIRPGNQHEEVNIYFLATKGSMDAWQVGLLTSKAEGLRDIQRPPGEGDDDNDTVEEIGASDWDYATMAAEIGGNPYMRQFMEAQVRLKGLEADRRNAAADRVRQAELLLAKENELASTQRAIAARDAALPKVTATIRGDTFQIRVGGRDFDKRGEAGPVVRQAVADALRGHSSLGMGSWTVIGTFGGLDFAVRPEILDGGEIRAHVGFPDLRHSESVCSIGDLANPKFGGTIIGRLATALEKAEDHQLMDRERLPVLEAEITLLAAQQASVDYGPAIEHARRRVELLDAVVGAVTERDKLPELTESMLDPQKYPTPESRKKAIAERAKQRAPYQAKVDQAAAALAVFDETTPAPELPTAPAPASNPAPVPAPAPDETTGRRTTSSGAHPVDEAQAPREQASPEPEESSTEEPAEQSAEPPGDTEERPPPSAEAPAVEDVTTLYAPGEQVRVTPMNYDTWNKTYVPQPEFIGTVISYTRNGNYMVREPEHGTSKHYDALRELHKLDTEPADSEASPPTLEQRNTSQQPTEPTPEQDSDGYGTANLYEEFGLAPPERILGPAPQDEPETDTEGDGDGIPDGQMTVEEVQPEAAPARHDTASAGAADDGRERLTSADGRLTFTLLAVPADAGFHQEAVEDYQRRRSEFAAVVAVKDEQATQTPAEQADQLARWRRTYKAANRLAPFRPLPPLSLTHQQDAPGLTPAEYDIGSWVTWRDGRNGQQVTGQVMSPGASKDTWYVSTDRTGVTGEYHVLSRSGKKATGYTYALNGAAVDLRPADGPAEQVPFKDMPPVDSIPAEPLTSYADYVPRKGLAVVRKPIPVVVGETTPRGPELVFDVLADGVPFVVKVTRHEASGTQLFTPHIEIDGEEVRAFGRAESRGEAVEICERVVREAREDAARPLRAHHRDYDFALAAGGRCGGADLHAADAEPQPLYRVGDSEPLCFEHVVSTFNVERSEVSKLARARQIWGTRVAAEPATAAVPEAPPADAEQHNEQQPEGPAAQETATAAASQDPHEVAREALQGGDRITIVVSGRSIEWDGEAWGLPVPETATVTGTVYPGYRDYHQNTTLLDAVILDQTGREVTAPESVFIRQLPARAQLIPAEHRDDLRPETRTVAQIRLGDLIADGGTRGETVTELRFADNNRRGSVMAFSTRDVAKGTANGFALNLTDEVQVVPRERRAPQVVAAVFGRHGSHDQVALETQRTYDLHAAVAEVTSRVWPDGAGPQDEIQALSGAIGAIDATARGVDAYRANAAAMEAAEAAAAALFAATDDDILNRYVGLPLHRLRQHLDVQARQLRADADHLEQGARDRTATSEEASDVSATSEASTNDGLTQTVSPQESLAGNPLKTVSVLHVQHGDHTAQLTRFDWSPGRLLQERDGQWHVTCESPGRTGFVTRRKGDAWCRTKGDAYRLFLWHAEGERGAPPDDSVETPDANLPPSPPEEFKGVRLGSLGPGQWQYRRAEISYDDGLYAADVEGERFYGLEITEVLEAASEKMAATESSGPSALTPKARREAEGADVTSHAFADSGAHDHEEQLAALTANSAEQNTVAPESAAADKEATEQPSADVRKKRTEPSPDDPAVAAEHAFVAAPADVEQPTPTPTPDRTRARRRGSAVAPGAGTEQLGLFDDPAQDPAEGPAEPETASDSRADPADEPLAQSVMTEDGREAQLRAALIEGETIAPVSFTDSREPATGWILTTAGGHTFRLRPVTYARPDEDQWEAGHDAEGSHWWAANLEDRPLTAVLARIREDSATRTRFASLWARYAHLTAQAPQFETTTDRVQLEEGVYLVSRFGRIGLIASCRWGWEHLTDPDGAQGRTGEDWSRKGPDNRQYVAEWKIWHSAQQAIPNARLRVVAQLTDDMTDTPDAYCDASTPHVGKCSAKRSGARYTVAVDTDQGSELGHYTVCARCLSHRLLNDEDRHIGHRDVQSLVEALAKGDPKVGDLHWRQWPDRIAEVAGQMLSAALDAGETAPWPAQALTAQIIAEACEAGDDRAMREARAEVKAAGGDAKAQKRAADEAFTVRQDRAALVARRGSTPMEAANEADRVAVAILELAGLGVGGSDAATKPAEAVPEVVDVNTLTVSPRGRNGELSSYEFTVTGPGLTVGKYEISHDNQGKDARGIMWRATWHGVEPSGRWDVISIGAGEGESAALAAVAEHATKTGGDLAAGFTVARRMRYDAGLWILPEVGESEAIQYHPDGSWTITAETGASYTVRREWQGRTASGDLAPLLIEDQSGTLIASCTAVDSYMSAWAPMLERLRLHATAVADGVPHATAVTLGGPGMSWVEAWCVCSWTERADVAEDAGRAPAGEALALAHRQAHHPETSAAAEAPVAAEVPELDVVLLDVDLATLDVAGPYETDREAQADIDRLSAAFARWDALPTVQRYYEADRQQRSDGQRIPTNPVAQLATAYRDAERMLREGPAISPADLVLEVHTVAVWSGVLETVVNEDLRGPLRQVREAAALLASRSQATVAAFEAELAALTANSAERNTAAPQSAAADTGPAEQPPADADDAPEPRTEQGPDAPAAAAEGLGEPPAGTPTADTETESVTDDNPAPAPRKERDPSAAVDDASGDTAADTVVDDDPASDRLPAPQTAPEPAGATPDEGMHEEQREASFHEKDRPQTTDGDQQTPEPGTAAAPAPALAGEAAPSDETVRDASEEPTMTTPPIPDTTEAPGEPTTEEPPEPQRYVETAALAGDASYRLRLSGLDGQPFDSGEVLQGDLVIATIHPAEFGWFARLAVEDLPADVTYLADTPQGAAGHAAVIYSALTGAPYGPPADAAVGDTPHQRVDALRTNLRDTAEHHRNAVIYAARRAYPDFEQDARFQDLISSLAVVTTAVSDSHNSQQMTSHLDAVQRSVNQWGATLPTNPAHPERRQMAFPLAHLLYDSRRLQDQVQATLAAVQAERAAVREQAAPTEPAPEVRPEPTTAADTGASEEPTELQSPEVPDSQTSQAAREEPLAAPAEPADAAGPESPNGAAPPEDNGPALDSAVDGIRRALEDALQAVQPVAVRQPGELPLWTTSTETPPAGTAVTEPPAGPLDVRTEFQAVLEAWEEHVSPENGTAQDLVADLDADLATLQRAFAEAVAPAAPAAPPAATDPATAAPDKSVEAAAPPPGPQQAADVNAALQQADTHDTALQDLPEWRQIQTVRGAFGHLFRVMKERAGEHFDRLMGDHRVGEFFRKVSIAACDKVAGWAQAAADRLRQRGEGNGPDAPAADALRGVADAATGYASPSGPPSASRDAASATVDIPALRQLGEALSRPLPAAKAGRVSAAAARGKSTTRRGSKKPNGIAKKPGAAAKQAGHLRRGGAESQQQNHRPTQR
ncbi:hypothetical protein C3492_35505 [Streptomyces sp. Ru62]|nr:hypothetical protein C3492_35505 [Streptomyces sp. Ru62]